MDEEIVTFEDIEIEKDKFYRYKSPIFLEDVDIENIVIFKKRSPNEKNNKYFLVTCMMIIKLNHHI